MLSLEEIAQVALNRRRSIARQQLRAGMQKRVKKEGGEKKKEKRKIKPNIKKKQRKKIDEKNIFR